MRIGDRIRNAVAPRIFAAAAAVAKMAALWRTGIPVRDWSRWRLTIHGPATDIIVIDCPPGDDGGEVTALPKATVLKAFALWNQTRAAQAVEVARQQADAGSCGDPDCPDCNPAPTPPRLLH